MLSTTKQHSKNITSPSHNTKTRKQLPSWYSDSLPKVKRATTRRHSKTKSPYSKNPFDKPLKAYNKFKQTLLPDWVGKIPYPKEVDIIPEKTIHPSFNTGVADIYNQLIWRRHLDLMKKKFKLPKTEDLWTPEQIVQLKDFYMVYGPDRLEKELFNRIIHLYGPSTAKELLINIYSNKYRGKFKQESLNKIMQININPYEFTLKKNTILYHYSPHMLPFRKIKFDDSTRTGFVFFGLSALISIWYANEKYTHYARSKIKKEFTAYLNVYRLDKDIKVKYIEDDVSENQEADQNLEICNYHPCLHPQFAYHSDEQAFTKRGPVELDFELTLPINLLQGRQKLNLEPLGVYNIDVEQLANNSLENIETYNPLSAVNFSENLL